MLVKFLYDCPKFTGCGPEEAGFNFRQGQDIFIFSETSELALGSSQSHLHGFRVSLQEVPRPGPEVNRPYPSSVQVNLLKPTGHVMHLLFNIQQLYALSTLYLFVLYLSEKKQRLVPLTA
jgi:hypothetical protein